MIELQEVAKNFGAVQAVRGVSFTIGTGQVVGLLGPNGAGKTTTIRMITGTLPPSRGRATVDGLHTIDQSRRVRSLLGYLPENAPLYGEMRVESYLVYRAGLFGMSGRSRRDAVQQAMERCRIADVSRRRVGHLSKGYRQRVGLAAALVHNPRVLILDEPTTGLDPSQIAETRSLIRDLAGDRTMLLVSHILPEVQRTCDRIIIFARGRVQADGRPAELIEGSGGGRRCVLEARTEDVAALTSRIKGLDSVSGTDLEEGDGAWRRWRIAAAPGSADPRAAIGEACLASGAVVRELRMESSSLEEFYIRTIEAADRRESEASA